jgi:hypothetical protein
MCTYVFSPFLPFHQSINTIVVVVHFLIAFKVSIQLKDIVYDSYITMGLFKLKVYLLPSKNAIWVCELWIEGDWHQVAKEMEHPCCTIKKNHGLKIRLN